MGKCGSKSIPLQQPCKHKREPSYCRHQSEQSVCGNSHIRQRSISSEQRNHQLETALKEMREIRKGIHDKKENDALFQAGKAEKCPFCTYSMPHLTTRCCTCHALRCRRYNSLASCTFFRLLLSEKK